MAINTIFTNYNHSLIGGGKNNSIKNRCAVIVGGANNAVSGAYSAILGGSGNTVSAAYSYAGVFGQGVSAVASNTFHVEALNTCAAPLLGSGAPCTLSYLIATPGMVAVGFPLGSKIAMIG